VVDAAPAHPQGLRDAQQHPHVPDVGNAFQRADVTGQKARGQDRERGVFRPRNADPPAPPGAPANAQLSAHRSPPLPSTHPRLPPARQPPPARPRPPVRPFPPERPLPPDRRRHSPAGPMAAGTKGTSPESEYEAPGGIPCPPHPFAAG